MTLTRMWRMSYPAMDGFFRGDRFVLRVDLAGVDPKDVSITSNDHQLILRGERLGTLRDGEERYLFSEIFRGPFERIVNLPEGVKGTDAEARYVKGVLEISMPVEDHLVPQRVAIQVNDEIDHEQQVAVNQTSRTPARV